MNISTAELRQHMPKLHKVKTCSGQSGGKSRGSRSEACWHHRLPSASHPHRCTRQKKQNRKKKIFASRSRRFPSPTDIDVFIRLNLCAASKCLIICNGDSLGCLRYVVMLSAEREWEMAEWEGRLNHPALLGEPLKRIEWGSTNFYFQRHIL